MSERDGDAFAAAEAATVAWMQAISAAYAAAGGPTVRDLARAAKVSPASAHDVVVGRRVPSWALAQSVLSAMGADPASFQRLWADAKRTQALLRLQRQAVRGHMPMESVAAPRRESEDYQQGRDEAGQMVIVQELQLIRHALERIAEALEAR